MKKLSVKHAIISLALITSLWSCASYNSSDSEGDSKNTIEIGDFTEIETAGVDVDLKVGPDAGKVLISGPEELTEHLVVKLSGHTLEIKYDKSIGRQPKDRAKVTVTTSQISDIEASIGAKVKVFGTLDSDKSVELEAMTGASILVDGISTTKECELTATTGATIKIETLNAETLEITATTGALADVATGSARLAELTASTGATISCAGVTAATGSANANTAASISCNIKNLRDQNAGTGGSIKNN